MNINVLVGYNTVIIFLKISISSDHWGMKAKSTHAWAEPLNDTV